MIGTGKCLMRQVTIDPYPPGVAVDDRKAQVPDRRRTDQACAIDSLISSRTSSHAVLPLHRRWRPNSVRHRRARSQAATGADYRFDHDPDHFSCGAGTNDVIIGSSPGRRHRKRRVFAPIYDSVRVYGRHRF